MPNTLTSIFTSVPATYAVEAQHPNTPGLWVAGTQLANGTWQVIHTGVSKTSTPPTVTGRLVTAIATTASVVATGNVLNIVPLAPAGTSATGTSTGISVTASTSPNGLANRILASGASTGPFTQIYQGITSSYSHALAAGTTQYYQYQYVGSGFYDDSPVSSFSGIATPPGAATIAVSFADSDYYNTLAVVSGQTRRSAFARVAVQTDATSMSVTYTSTNATLGVASFTAGVYDTYATGGVVGTNTITMPIAGTGTRLVELVTSLQGAGSGDVDPIVYTKITSVTFTGGTTATKAIPTGLADRIVVNGDSITVGAVSAIPQRDGWQNQLSLLRPALQFISDGWGAKSAVVRLSTAALRSPIIAASVAALAGATTKRYYLSLGTNDSGADPTTVASYIGAFADELYAADPTIIFYAQTMLPYGASTLRTAITNLGQTRSRPQFRIIDGSILTTKYVDGIHPTAVGYTEVAAGINNQLDLAPAQLTTPVLLHAWEGNNTSNIWQDMGTGGHSATIAANAPQLITAPTVFGKAAYLFANDGALHWLKLPALSTTLQPVTVLLTARGLSATAANQYLLDLQTGRLSVAFKAGGAFIAGAAFAGPAINPLDDTFFALVLRASNATLTINDTVAGTYSATNVALSTPMTIGGSYGQDAVAAGSAGTYFGYIGAVEIYPGELTTAQIAARKQLLVAPSATSLATGTQMSVYDAVTFASTWTTVANLTAADAVSGAVIYTTTAANYATHSITLTQPGYIKHYSNKSPGYGTNLIKLTGAATVSYSFSAAGTAGPPVLVGTSPLLQAGTYMLSQETQTAGQQVIIDRIILVAA